MNESIVNPGSFNNFKQTHSDIGREKALAEYSAELAEYKRQVYTDKIMEGLGFVSLLTPELL